MNYTEEDVERVARALCVADDDDPDRYWRDYAAGARAALSSIPRHVPEGWVMVPKEPTEYMLLKAETAYAVPWVRPMLNAYQALILNAPPHPKEGL